MNRQITVATLHKAWPSSERMRIVFPVVSCSQLLQLLVFPIEFLKLTTVFPLPPRFARARLPQNLFLFRFRCPIFKTCLAGRDMLVEFKLHLVFPKIHSDRLPAIFTRHRDGFFYFRFGSHYNPNSFSIISTVSARSERRSKITFCNKSSISSGVSRATSSAITWDFLGSACISVTVCRRIS